MFAGLPAALVALAMLALAPILPLADTTPEFRLGFKLLADQVPTLTGQPLEEERHNPINGDALQSTTTGLMVWRKADNWTAFTNGWRSWVNGPLGLQERGNEERFPWEASLPSGGSAQPAAASPVYTTPISQSSPLSTVAPAPPPDLTPRPTAVVPVPSPSQLPVSPSPTARPTATARPSPTTPPTPRVFAGGTLSADPAGKWVTSISWRTSYYTSVDSSYWRSWAAQNRIWFGTEAELLAAFPGRTRR